MHALTTMKLKITSKLFFICFISAYLTGCFQPPFNNFKPTSFDFGSEGFCEKPNYRALAERNTIASQIIRRLGARAIQFVKQGDRMTLIVPTDRYYMFNSHELDDTEFVGLNHIADLLKLFPCSYIIVAGFSDHVGKTTDQDKLTEERAETMLTFLWAKGIPAQRLKAEGFGKRFPVGNYHIVHGNAYNRRIEIQWWAGKHIPPKPAPAALMTK